MAYLRSLLPTDRSPAPSSTASQPVPRVLQLDTTPDMLQNGTPASTLGSESVMIQSPSAHWVGPDIRRDLEAQKLPASPPVMRLPLAEVTALVQMWLPC